MISNKLKQLKRMYEDVGYRKKFIALFVLIVVTAVLEIITVPHIVKQILDVEIPEQNIQGLILFVCLHIMILLLQCYMVLKHCEMRCFLLRWIKSDFRKRIFTKLQKVKAKFFDEHETGVVLQFLQEDTQNAGELFPITITEMFTMGTLRFSIVAIFLMFVNLKISLMILGLYALGLFVTLYFNRKTITGIIEIRRLNSEVYTAINEGIQSFLTIKTLGIINQKIEELQNKLKEYNEENSNLEKIISKYNTIFSFITSFTSIVIVYFGGMEIIQGVMTYAEIMLMIDYSKYIEFEFSWFTRHLTDFNECFFAYSKILELLEKEEEEDLNKGEKLEDKITNIVFSKVSFSYNNSQKNIKNFSLTVGENERVALIGKTGAGKTTVTNLLERLYEPQQGEIQINGKDYREYTISSIRDKIGYIMQEVQIVPNTIIDNIRYVNKKITKEEIIDIFKELSLHEKIMSLPKGYETNIYENSDILSTGEKQMISFARIMAVSPDVVILDEVTSNLSWENEELIKNAMKKVMKGRITFMVAHRLSTIEGCNQIVEMKNGQIYK